MRISDWSSDVCSSDLGLDDRRRDRVVPATRAQRADLALVVAPGEADGVAAERGVVEFWFGEVGHATFSRCTADPGCAPIAPAMTRAVIGVPSARQSCG